MNEHYPTDARQRRAVREASIFDYIHVIAKHWKLVLVVCVPVIAATVVWSLYVTETFRAEASIVPPIEGTQPGGIGLAGGLLGGTEGALLRSALNVTSVADMYVGILESRTMAEGIVDQFDLTQVYGPDLPRWRTLKKLGDNTDIKVTKEGIVQVSVIDTDPNRAAAMANAYVDKLDKQNKRLSGSQATSKRIFLETRLKEIEERLSQIDSIPTHEAQVQEILYELLMRESEIAKIEEAKSMPTIQVLDKAVPPEHKYEPVRRVMVMKAAVGSFAVAVFLAFLFEYRNRSRNRDVQPWDAREETADGLERETDQGSYKEERQVMVSHPGA